MWNACDDDALFAILAPDVRFRGSTEAVDRVGPEAFKMYLIGVLGNSLGFRV